MSAYVLRRILLIVPTMWGVATLIFIILRVLPGDIAQLALEGTTDPAALSAARHQLGIDVPLWEQYVGWLGQLAHGSLGSTFRLNSSLNTEVLRAFPVTAHVAVLGLLIALGLSLPLGILSAIRRGSRVDYVARTISIVGLSMPAFWLGILILIVLSRTFNWIPPLQWVAIWQDPWRNIQIIIWPSLAVGFIEAGTLTRIVRSSMLDVLGQDYVRTAQAKGLSSLVVVVRHALPNGLIAVVTVLGTMLATLLGGLVVTETVFNLPGMGYLLVRGVSTRDYPTVQAMALVISAVFVLTNLMIDIAYAVIDPRIRYS